MGKPRKTEADYHAVARKKGIEWVGELPMNIRTQKTLWRCSIGHEWSTTYSSISSAKQNGCPYCARKFPLSERDFHELAKKRGFTLIEAVTAPSVSKRVRWRCSSGHEWVASYNNIRNGWSCPVCSNRARKSASDYADLARQRNYIWLGPGVESVKGKTNWQCPNGHTWATDWNTFKGGSECPECHNRVNGVFVSKPQLALNEMLEGEVNRPTGRYFIDIALELFGFKIAVEYDCRHWHNPEHDAKRDAYLIQHDWRILRIKSGTQLPASEQLDAALNALLDGKTYTEIVLADW